MYFNTNNVSSKKLSCLQKKTDPQNIANIIKIKGGNKCLIMITIFLFLLLKISKNLHLYTFLYFK